MAFSFINLRPQEQNNALSKLQDIGSQSIDDFFRQRQNQKTYQDILGLDPNTAKSMANYDLPEVMQLLQALGQREGGLEALTGLGNQQQIGQQQMMTEQKPGVSQPLTVAQVLGRPTKAQQREDKKLALEERKVLSKEELGKHQFTKDYINSIYDKAESADMRMMDLDRMKELETEGEGLDSTAWNEFLKRSGFDIAALRNPQSEEFIKLRQGFIRGARDAFGGRVTNFELDEWLKAIPDLSNSPEGRKRLIAGLQKMYRLEQKQAEIADDIIEKNNGVPPLNLRSQVYKSMKEEQEKAADQFKKDLKRSVPKGSSKYATVAGSLAGTATKTAANIGIPAATGALLGSVIPGLGTGLGALGGGLFGAGALGLDAISNLLGRGNNSQE